VTDDEKKKSHIGDALAHAMIAPTEEVEAEPQPAPAPAVIAQDEAVEDVRSASISDDDPRAVESGETVLTLERYWPMIWLAMLTVVSVIGIYNSVRHLP
jgi:hypothetical protein